MRLIVLLVAFLISFNSFAAESQRQLYTRAESALKNGNLKHFRQMQKQLDDYPLAPYLEMKAMQRRFRIKNIKHYQKFIQRYPNTPIASNMKGWLRRHLAKTHQWDLIVKYFKNSKNTEYQCIYLNARLKRKEDPNTIWPDVIPLWITPESLPKQCDPVLAAWKKANQLTDQLLWQRLTASLINSEYALAEYLVKDQPTEARKAISSWVKLFRSPHRINKKRLPQALDSEISLALQDALYKKVIKRTKLDKLPLQLDMLQEKSTIEWTGLPKASRAVALKLALAGEPAADVWLKRSLAQKADPVIQEWYLRWLIGQQDWNTLVDVLAELPESISQTTQWRYWHARALEANGADLTANAIYKEIAKTRNYYGLMASWQLDQPVAVRTENIEQDPQLLQQLSQLPFVERAKEFFLLGQVNKARLEWNAGVRQLPDDQAVDAAQLAISWGWYDRAIFSMRLPGAKDYSDQLDLRFPLAWREPVKQQSIRYELPPALIYAIARLESDFMSDARSPVGAYGLMQLLPGTAKQVARGYAIPLSNRRDLLNPQTNIRLGSAYLHRLSEKFSQNYPLAIAAYNAGPNRVRRWLPDSPMAPDVWIETIPYKETRNYVQNSLIYTAIYQQHLGGQLDPRKMLTTIQPLPQIAKLP
ncbi:transglycosylase SLT domain-containing protein [Pelagibaculum spongiae]|uniref:Murein transglycosylase n=1 Tax=Pelagibaculum spongiae TaxID=2080658 RepID=A0A2V1GU39_9GAMM|nr:transglycosylase SLT domain-containing protein [Pelagibaculum spongiae]PVZ69529.1 hypothetical protein DC094_09385 [Pelagibaculum spongiae]